MPPATTRRRIAALKSLTFLTEPCQKCQTKTQRVDLVRGAVSEFLTFLTGGCQKCQRRRLRSPEKDEGNRPRSQPKPNKSRSRAVPALSNTARQPPRLTFLLARARYRFICCRILIYGTGALQGISAPGRVYGRFVRTGHFRVPPALSMACAAARAACAACRRAAK
jgi:hypothetical protein